MSVHTRIVIVFVCCQIRWPRVDRMNKPNVSMS